MSAESEAMDTENTAVLAIGIGTIGPEKRLEENTVNAERLDELCDRLQRGEFSADIDPEALPTTCVDGRSREGGVSIAAANAAAGTFSAVVGDALTTNRFRENNVQSAGHAQALYSYLVDAGRKVGGHDADHHGENGCGCGAEDNLTAILQFIHDDGDKLRSVLKSLNVDVDDALHAQIMRRAGELIAQDYVSSGAEMRTAFTTVAGDESVETLVGPHNEVVLVVNTQPGKTLDRAALAKEFGAGYQAFNVDLPALQKAAEATSLTPEEATQKYIAMLYYNVATAAVLSDSSLRIVVR